MPYHSSAAQVRPSESFADARSGTPRSLWLLWALSVIATALWIWWGAFSSGTPLDLTFLMLRSTLVGLLGLIAITLIEMHIAPWRFLEP